MGDVLSHGHLFGLKADVKSNVHFVEEHLVVYPCGHSVVFLHVESRAQQVRKRERERDSLDQTERQTHVSRPRKETDSVIVLWTGRSPTRARTTCTRARATKK